MERVGASLVAKSVLMQGAAVAMVMATALLVWCLPMSAQVVKAGGCTVDMEGMQLPSCAITLRNGQLYVKAPFVHAAYRFEPYSLVYMSLQGEEGWAYFDRSGRVLVQHVATMDNGADAPRHGTVRVTVKGKWGIAAITGRALTPLQYDGIVYAEHGYSACTGCRTMSDGEHSSFEGGRWIELGFRGRPLTRRGGQR